MDFNAIFQGKFTSTGLDTTIKLVSDVDWMRVYNLTTLAAGGAGTGVEFYWQRGMDVGSGIEYKKLAADDSMSPSVLASGGFTLIDSANVADGALTAITAISAAATPVVSTGDTSTLAEGSVVRFINVTGAQQFGGIDFEIDNINPNVSFDLPYAPQIVAGTNGNYRKIFYQPSIAGTPPVPRPRYITKITQAAQAVVTLSVTHGYTVGAKVLMVVPAAYGMVQMDGRLVTITAVDLVNNTITIDVDSTAFTAFAFPLTTADAFTPAQTVPAGAGAELSVNDPYQDPNFRGMILSTGVDSPAGVVSDVIYWVAGKSFSVDNN